MHELVVRGVVPAQKTLGSLLEEAGLSPAPKPGQLPTSSLTEQFICVRRWARCCGSLMLIAYKVPALRQLPV